MFRKRIILSLFAVMAFSGVARAENSHLYIGFMGGKFDSKYNTTEYSGGMVNLGVDVNNYFAFEVAGGASQTEQNGTTSSKIDHVVSGFARFNLRFDRVTLYVLAGYSAAQGTATTGNTTVTSNDDGGSYGYGIDFFGTRDLALSVRRIEFYDIDKNNVKSNLGATIYGITYYFDTPKIHSRY